MVESPLTPRPTHGRRWFRFSLRTMFVLVTLFSIYLWWALDWKRQRYEFLNDPNVQPQYITALTPVQQYFRAPLALWLVGAQGYEFLLIDYPTEEQLKEGGKLFPEATLLR